MLSHCSPSCSRPAASARPGQRPTRCRIHSRSRRHVRPGMHNLRGERPRNKCLRRGALHRPRSRKRPSHRTRSQPSPHGRTHPRSTENDWQANHPDQVTAAEKIRDNALLLDHAHSPGHGFVDSSWVVGTNVTSSGAGLVFQLAASLPNVCQQNVAPIVSIFSSTDGVTGTNPGARHRRSPRDHPAGPGATGNTTTRDHDHHNDNDNGSG